MAARIAAYCRRFGVPPSGDALPPFPSGKRETAQHREWMALYKAQQRIHGRAASARGADAARLRELLDAQRGRCAICRKPLGPEEARLDRVPEAATADAVVVHPSCFELLALVRTLGPEALERARQRAR